MAATQYASVILIAYLAVLLIEVPSIAKASRLEQPRDEKAFKKMLRTYKNVLVLATNKPGANSDLEQMLRNVATKVAGIGTTAVIDCSTKEGRKICRKQQINPNPFVLRHYWNGEYLKDYDRSIKEKSIVRFLQDPTGPTPWDEVEEAQDILHLTDKSFAKLKERKTTMLVMFYAPWCGHCKTLKPKYEDAAKELKKLGVVGRLAAIDADSSAGRLSAQMHDINSYPTLLYFEKGELQQHYQGPRTTEGIIAFMQDPLSQPLSPPSASKNDESWAEMDSHVVHLTGDTFFDRLANETSALVMFYAPKAIRMPSSPQSNLNFFDEIVSFKQWCGHCKAFKQPFMDAAHLINQDDSVEGILGAVDCTLPSNQQLCKEQNVNGFPTIKHFILGKFHAEYNFPRTKDAVITFMRDPEAPPPPPPPAEQPWSALPSDVVHLSGNEFQAKLKKKKHSLVFFYAPWCGHCKRTKPEYESAAAQASDRKVMFAAVDCTSPENDDLCSQNDINAYPTIKYFKFGKFISEYDGPRNADGFQSFLQKFGQTASPKAPPAEFMFDETTVVAQLTETNFRSHVDSYDKTLVFFFAPWCGFCRSAKPELIAAANFLANSTEFSIAAVNCGEQLRLCQEHGIQGFPTIYRFSRNSDEGTKYEDKRFAKEFIEFLTGRRRDEL